MFYNEKVIDGVMCWQNQPDGEWTPMTPKELTDRVLMLQGRIDAVKVILDR